MPATTTASSGAGGPLFDLACAACGEAYPAGGFPAVCAACGGCWEHGDGFAWRPPTAAGGLRRWAPALGLDPDELPARELASPPGLYVASGAAESASAAPAAPGRGTAVPPGPLAAQEWRRRLTYAAPFYQPSFVAGVATLAWDLFEELGAPLPAHWLLPAGNGPLLLGVALGLSCLVRAGKLDRLPALHAVQLDGYAALSPDGPGQARPGPPVAGGIAIARPPRRADLVRCVDASGGDVIRVGEEEIATAPLELATRS